MSYTDCCCRRASTRQASTRYYKLRSIYLFAVTDDGTVHHRVARSASAENVEANYTFDQPDGSDGLDADPRGTHLENDRGLDIAAW